MLVAQALRDDEAADKPCKGTQPCPREGPEPGAPAGQSPGLGFLNSPWSWGTAPAGHPSEEGVGLLEN